MVDLLTQALEGEGFSRENVGLALRTWLLKDFLQDRYAALTQAGRSPDERILLARVFIDLRVSEREIPESEALNETVEQQETLPFASTLLAEKFAPCLREGKDALLPNAHILIGGPGQGKSTVGQFVAQNHRAVLLDAHRGELREEDRKELDELRAQCAQDGFTTPVRPLFPVRVELRNLAAWLAGRSAETANLAEYLAHDIQLLAGLPMVAHDLRAALSRVPLLLVLDGLDEVPPGESRDLVTRVVWDFLRTGRAHDDVVIASTRPYGYAQEFKRFRAWHLAPLSAKTALEYAKRLVGTWFHGRERDQLKTLKRVEQALAEETTARLMRSPLQVTIMVILVSGSGDVPRSRWELFDEYYKTLYKREKERDTYASALLANHSSVIDAVHDHVGLLLQTEGETAERAASLLPRERLVEIIVHHLNDRGHLDEARARALAEEILRATSERLVLLAESQPGSYRFDVRSLQEFTAARQLITTGESSVAYDRLRTVARSPYWRNVTRFAVGRFFSGNVPQTTRHRMSVGLCAQVADDHTQEHEWGSFPGAELALSLLEDGAVTSDLRCVRALALQVLPLFGDSLDWEVGVRVGRVLASHWGYLEQEGRRAVVETLHDALEEAVKREARSPAWLCAVVLASVPERAEVRGILDAAWSRMSVEWRQGAFFRIHSRPRAESIPWLWERLDAETEQFSFELFARPHLALRNSVGPRARLAMDFLNTRRRGGLSLRLVAGATEPVGSVGLGAFIEDGAKIAAAPFTSGSWAVFGVVRPFLVGPSANTLASSLRVIAELKIAPDLAATQVLPWPLAASLHVATTPETQRALADRIDAGALGDVDVWRAMEKAWAQDGFVLDDLLYEPAEGLPFDPITHGLPVSASAWPREEKPIDVSALEALLLRARDAWNEVRARVSEFVLWACEFRDESAGLQFSSVALEVLLSFSPSDLSVPIQLFAKPSRFSSEVIDHLDDLLRRRESLWLEGSMLADPGAVAREWAALWLTRRTRVGVLRLLAVLSGWQEVLPDELRHQIDYTTFDSPNARWNALRLQAGFGELDEIPTDRLTEDLRSVSGAADAREIYDLLYSWGGSQERLNELVDALWQRRDDLPFHWTWSLRVWKVGYFRSLKTALGTPSRWAALELPFPGPEVSGATQEVRPWTELITLSSIEVKQLRAFESLAITPRPSPADGQWVVLLGENGAGKTTVLRAIALALASPETATELARQSPAPHRRDTAPRGTVAVTFNGLHFGALLNGDPGAETVRADKFTRDVPDDARPWVVGYGCRRGSVLGGAKREVAFGPREQLDSLFDGDRGLVHAETWLGQQKLAAALDTTGVALGRYKAIQRVLCELLQLDAIDVEADARVRVRSKATGAALLAGLSDGYVTTAGWIIDLIARWVARCVAFKKKYGERFDDRAVLGERFHEHMTGLVLLDEIDLHLHPRWQMRVLETVRKAFPKLSFVVTTHNPLTLLAAREGEVWVLRRPAEDGTIHPLQLDLPKGARIEHILTGAWFELDSTFDPDTRARLAEHRTMLREGVAVDDPRRMELEALLRARLVSVGDTWIERIGIEAAHRALAETNADLPSEDPEEFRRWVEDTLQPKSGTTPGE
jgi:hypothetical protein